MKVNRCRHLFSICGQLLTFIRKFYEGKKSYFGRRVFIFVLPIRNKSPFSGKIITPFKIERMTLNLLAMWPNHKIEMRLRWQKSTSLGIRVTGPEYRRMEHRKTLWWGCCCKKRENHYVSRRWHPSLNRSVREMHLWKRKLWNWSV